MTTLKTKRLNLNRFINKNWKITELKEQYERFENSEIIKSVLLIEEFIIEQDKLKACLFDAWLESALNNKE